VPVIELVNEYDGRLCGFSALPDWAGHRNVGGALDSLLEVYPRCQGYRRIHEYADSLLVESFQGSPRHIWYDVPASISQSDICRLHERVDTNDFKNAFVLSGTDRVAPLRDSCFGFCSHLLPPALRFLVILRVEL